MLPVHVHVASCPTSARSVQPSPGFLLSVQPILRAPLPRVWDAVDGRLAEPTRATISHGHAHTVGGDASIAGALDHHACTYSSHMACRHHHAGAEGVPAHQLAAPVHGKTIMPRHTACQDTLTQQPCYVPIQPRTKLLFCMYMQLRLMAPSDARRRAGGGAQ